MVTDCAMIFSSFERMSALQKFHIRLPQFAAAVRLHSSSRFDVSSRSSVENHLTLLIQTPYAQEI